MQLSETALIFGCCLSQADRIANGQTFQTVLDSARPGERFVLPADTLEIEIEGSQPTDGLNIRKDVLLEGESRWGSKVLFYPNDPSFDYYCFYVDADVNADFRDFTLEGPTGLDKSDIWNQPTVRGIYGYACGNMSFVGLNVLGDFRNAIYFAGAPTADLLVRDCDITCAEVAIASFGPSRMTRVEGGHIHDIVSKRNDGHYPGIGIYQHEIANLSVRGTHFTNVGLYPIQCYEVGETGYADLVDIDGIRVVVDDPGLLAALYGSGIWGNEGARTVIRNSYFKNTAGAIKINGATDIVGCIFDECISPIETAKDAVYDVNVVGSHFLAKGQNPQMWIHHAGVKLDVLGGSATKTDNDLANLDLQSFICLENGARGSVHDFDMDANGQQNHCVYLDNSEVELVYSDVRNSRSEDVKQVGVSSLKTVRLE